MWFRNIFGAKRRTPGTEAAASPASAAASLSANALYQLNRLHLNTGRLYSGHSSGIRPSAWRRPDSDFREHRMYAPGDDVRFVDWKASARQEHTFIKQGEHHKDSAVYLLLDCSASMAWGDPAKSAAALSLAAAFGYLALAHGDRLSVLPMHGETSDQQGRRLAVPLGPVSGKGQFPTLLAYLRSVPSGGQIDLPASLDALRSRRRTRGGLVLILSDLLGVPDLSRALDALPYPAWNVIICHLLHPLELDPALNGDLEMRDIETGLKKNYTVDAKALRVYRTRMQAWQQSLQEACSQRNATYTLLPTHWSLESEMLPHLRRIHVVKPL